MPIEPPTLEDLRRAEQSLRLGMDETELQELLPLAAAFGAGVGALDDLAGDGPAGPVAAAARYRRDAGRAPGADENPYGAWAWLVTVEGAASGPLAGLTVAVKDSVALAGVPMNNGSAVMEGYVPDFDATVVTRILDAGGRIVGKAACEDMCLSAGSHTAVSGPVRNPHDPRRSTGGSSSGSAALVAAGVCDLAMGGDQGGSIRIPSALCGTVGIKPTHGRVPYTGAFPIDPTVDHLGPIGASVAGVARLLDVISGPDGLDPRQRAADRPAVDPAGCVDSLADGAAGLRVGVLSEGFGPAGVEPGVDACVRAAAVVMRDLGASVEEVSVPWHQRSGVLLAVLLATGMLHCVIHGDGAGAGWDGWYPESMVEWFAGARRERASRFSPNVKLLALVGQYLTDTFGNGHYARARNLVPALRAAYDAAFRDFDLLLLPTTSGVAPLLPPARPSVGESLGAAFANAGNTAQFDLTGHPAASVPCGRVDGLPVGMMLVGRRWEDHVVLRAAHAFEQSGVYARSA